MKKIILVLIIALLPLLACGDSGGDTRIGNDSYDVCRDCGNSERVDLEEKK